MYSGVFLPILPFCIKIVYLMTENFIPKKKEKEVIILWGGNIFNISA